MQPQVQSLPTDFFGSSANVPNPMNFSTGPINSPNMMHMNTYNGNGANFGFDQLNSNQFSTSANIMMKKTTSTTSNNNNNDLI